MNHKLWIAVGALAAAACQSELDTTRTPDPYSSFGDVIYREACQRVAYLGQLEQKAAGQLDRVDVSGSLGRSVCVDGQTPPTGAPPRLFAIAGQHGDVTSTVDAILPQPFLATLETFLERLLPLYDDGTLERAIGGLGDLLGMLHDGPEVTPALARLNTRHGYRAVDVHPGLLHALVEYPDLDAFVGNVVGLIAPGGAAEAEWRALMAANAVTLGTAEAEVDPAASERTLRLALDLLFTHNAELVTSSPRPVVLRDVRGLARASVGSDGAVIAPFVDVDQDGLADVDSAGRFVDAQGVALAVPTPFVDPDAVSAGRNDNAPRDVLGRAVVAPGSTEPLYQYADLDGTLLISALREAPSLLDADKDTALGLAWGASALLGPRTMQTRSYLDHAGAVVGSLSYRGFDVTQAPALDLLHAFVQVLGTPKIDQVLQATATLLRDHESATARAIAGILDAFDRGKQHPEAQIPVKSTVTDELAPLVARALRVPGLAQDLITALQDPHVRGMAPMIARLMTLNNQLDFNHTAAAIGSARGAPYFDLIGDLSTPSLVDRTKADVDYNRSIMQRIAHLIHDANGAEFCNKEGAIQFGNTYARCKLFQIKDLSLFFALNLASDAIRMDATRYDTTYSKASFREQIVDIDVREFVNNDEIGDGKLQGLVGINGFVRFPEPKALGRALFLRLTDAGASAFFKNTTEPMKCTDGDRFIDVHDRSVFAWELPLPNNPSGFADDNFFDAVRPLIDAFAKHDECLEVDGTGACTKSQNAVKIFVDMLSMLHEHWGSPQSTYFGRGYQSDRSKPRFASLDNVTSYEPLVAEILNGDLPLAVADLAPTLDTFTVDGTAGGERALPAMIDAMRFVFDPGVAPVGLAYRNGSTMAVMSDGRPAGRATPFTLLADGFADKRARLAAMTGDDALQASKWKTAASELVDLILTADHTGAAWQFRNRRFHGMTQILIDFVRARIAVHATAGDFDAWIHHDLTSDLTEKLSSPVFAALSDLTGRIVRDAGAKAQMYGLLNYLVDEAGHDQVFRTALTTLADQAQMFLDDATMVPIVRVFGNAMDPAKGIVNAQITLVKRTHDLDTDKALLTILRNLFRPDSLGIHPASNLADVVSAIDRRTPGLITDLDAADEASVLAALREFFIDNQRGFLRFVGIVRNRDPEKSAK